MGHEISRPGHKTVVHQMSHQRRWRGQSRKQMLVSLFTSSEWKTLIEFHQDDCADVLRKGIAQAGCMTMLQTKKTESNHNGSGDLHVHLLIW